MAISGDAAGIAMCHVAHYDKRVSNDPERSIDFREENRPVITVDFATAFTADPSATVPEDSDWNAGERISREVQIRWYRKLVWELKSRGFQIASVSNDGFESADALQILSAWGLNAQRISADRLSGGASAPYATLKDVLYDSRLRGYPNPKLVNELKRLQKLQNGKIDHPPTFSKDIADALACSVFAAVEVGGAEEGEHGSVIFADSAEVMAMYDAIFGGAPAQGQMGGYGSAFDALDPYDDVSPTWDSASDSMSLDRGSSWSW
jgi:hypothetical protein